MNFDFSKYSPAQIALSSTVAIGIGFFTLVWIACTFPAFMMKLFAITFVGVFCLAILIVIFLSIKESVEDHRKYK